MVIHEVMPQFLSGGIARTPRPTETLAAYAVAWGLAQFLASPMSQVRQLGMVLVRSRAQAIRVASFVLGCSGILAVIFSLLALTPAGAYVVEDLHGAAPGLSGVVRFALLFLIPFPILEAVLRLLSGLLLRVRRSEVVSAGTLAGIGASVVAVVLLLPTTLVEQRPICLPLLVTYVGVLTNLAVLTWGCLRFVVPWLRPHSAPDDASLDLAQLVGFFWPLALIMAIQGLSRPAINLFVSRGPDGEQALAALAVVYSLAHMPYGWLNEMRSLPVAFQEHGARGLRRIRRFVAACGLLSWTAMVVAFWVPAVRDLILLELLALPVEVAARCHLPLILFSFFPLTVAVRSYLHGVALLQRRTRALAPSAPARIGIILLALALLPAGSVPGATRGIAALLAGFVLEATTVWWFVRRHRLPSP